MNRPEIEKELDALLKKGIKKSDDADADDMKKSDDADDDDMKKGEGEPDEDEKEIEKALSDIEDDASEDEVKDKLYEKGYNKSFIDKAKAFRKGKVKKGLTSDAEVIDITPLYQKVESQSAEIADLKKSLEKVVTILKSVIGENESIKKSLSAPNQKGKTYIAKAIDKFDKKDTEPNQELVSKERFESIAKALRDEAYVKYNPDSQMNEPKNLDALDAYTRFVRTGDESYAKPLADVIKKSFPNINL